MVAAALAVVVGGGVAIAASQGSSPTPKSFFDAVAKHLGISSQKLRDATKAAAIDQVAVAVVEETAHRIAAHIAPIAAVADVALVVLGGGIGANGDLLLAPVREHLGRWMPYPPRVEISSLGEAAVLTGALAVGLRSALDNVFVRRGGAVAV